MLLDLQTLSEGTVLEADVCIVGAGPAGISLALTLRGSGLSVLLLEGGGFTYSEDSQRLYEGVTQDPRDAFDDYLSTSRARFLGGTSNYWAGWCRPLDPLDFEARSWVPHSGWPIAYDDVADWYDDAAEFVGLTSFQDASAWEGTARPPLSVDRIETLIWQFSSPVTRFGEVYEAALTDHDDIQLAVDANLVGITTNASSDHVRSLQIRTLGGRAFTVEATRYVLACGAIENARQLLLADLGGDAVGRFFMEHPHIRGSAELQLTPADLDLYIERESDDVSDSRTAGLLALPEGIRRDAELQQLAVMFRDVGEVDQDPRSLAVSRMLETWSGRVPAVGTTMVIAEQQPNPDSRVSLYSVEDDFGLPRTRLDWKLTRADWHSIVDSLERIVDALAEAGLGRAAMRIRRADPWKNLGPGWHHLGTARMSDKAADGVVDRDCKVHGVDNLYVAGSAVFPTGGGVNPTLTILALSLRLADHLESL